MRLPPSKRDNLFKDGASMRLYHDTKQKLRQLAGILGKNMAETLDEVVHQALEDALIRQMEDSNESTEL